jgi:hypothetical protein
MLYICNHFSTEEIEKLHEYTLVYIYTSFTIPFFNRRDRDSAWDSARIYARIYIILQHFMLQFSTEEIEKLHKIMSEIMHEYTTFSTPISIRRDRETTRDSARIYARIYTTFSTPISSRRDRETTRDSARIYNIFYSNFQQKR